MPLFAFRIGILAVAVTAVTLAAGAADAQAESPGDFVLCEQVPDMANRMACFNLALEKLRSRKRNAPPPPQYPREPDETTPDRGHQEKQSSLPMRPESPRAVAPRARSIVAGVVRHWRDDFGNFRVELENGQIWKETKASNYRLPGGNMIAEISKSLMGGYKLKIQGKKGFARVQPMN